MSEKISRKKVGHPTNYDENFHPQQFIKFKKRGYSNVEIMCKWSICETTFYDWVKKFPKEYERGLKEVEAYFDRMERTQLESPHPQFSAAAFTRMRRRMIKNKKFGFAEASIEEKIKIIDSLYAEDMICYDEWSKVRSTLSVTAIETLTEIYQELAKNKKK